LLHVRAVQPETDDAKSNAPAAHVAAIEAQSLVRRFGTVEAVANVSLTIRKGEFFSLLGPSGCGKTTLLRLIAGLDAPDAGSLKIGGADAASVPAYKRPVNTVFQSYALFPHMTVRDNIAFGLRMKSVPAPQVTERTVRVMSLVQISELADRKPSQISGGQKQRVALARALVNEPQVLLLDEPLGALDLQLRKQLQVELHELQRRLGITFIYVTHDQDEALVMSDRIAVMNAGRIEQMDDAEKLYEHPRTRFVAQFLGSCNLIEAEVESARQNEFIARTQVGPLRVNAADGSVSRRKLTLAIRPEKISLAKTCEASGPNHVRAQIEDTVYSGAETHYRLRANGLAISAVAMNAHAGRQGFHIGEEVQCCLPEQALIVLDD
jgi:spermidine/putrescine transport system ATP-binding protein